ncbi:MAG: DNA gyrase inhibitor YacG [Pseudomonadota bacterium]
MKHPGQRKESATACPICHKAVQPRSTSTNGAFPFCSDRCRAIDLGNWLSRRRRITCPISPPIHPAWLRHSLVTYREYAPSSLLAMRAFQRRYLGQVILRRLLSEAYVLPSPEAEAVEELLPSSPGATKASSPSPPSSSPR